MLSLLKGKIYLRNLRKNKIQINVYVYKFCHKSNIYRDRILNIDRFLNFIKPIFTFIYFLLVPEFMF